MAQLDQRVSVRCTLTHLSRDETGRYIYHRLNVAGAKGRIRVDDAAVRLIHQATGGVPRLVNLTSDRALLAGYSEQARVITESHVRQGLASLRGEDGIDSTAVEATRVLVRPMRRRTWITAIAVATLLLVLAAVAWWRFDLSAELLAWQAGRVASTRDAEQIYARIARDHRASRQRPTALLRLAQLQIARGSIRDALGWLEILRRDYPGATGRAERQYWTSRALLASGDTTQACATLTQVNPDTEGAFAADFAPLRTECSAFAARSQARDSISAAEDTSAAVREAGVAAQKADTSP